MTYFEQIKEELYKFENLGLETSEFGAILIGRATHIAPLAWLHSIYPVLNQTDITNLEAELGNRVPEVYEKFLLKHTNGIKVFSSTFTLYGYRKLLGRSIEASRQPFSIITPNTIEKPANAKASHFFIGGYEWDGSKLYIDTDTNKVHYCKRFDAQSLYEWHSFEEMLLSEVKRLANLFDEKGKIKDEDVPTTPVHIK